MKKWLSMLLTMVCALVLVVPAVQADVDFSGKKITWIIPYTPHPRIWQSQYILVLFIDS